MRESTSVPFNIVEKFLERYKIPKLIPEEHKNMNRALTSKEIVLVIKTIYIRKSQA